MIKMISDTSASGEQGVERSLSDQVFCTCRYLAIGLECMALTNSSSGRSLLQCADARTAGSSSCIGCVWSLTLKMLSLLKVMHPENPLSGKWQEPASLVMIQRYRLAMASWTNCCT